MDESPPAGHRGDSTARGGAKPTFVEPLRPARVLAKPQGFAPLRAFSCGRRGSRSEKLINKWALELFQGKRRNVGTVLVLEDTQGRLIGISSFRPRPLNTYEENSAASRYIHIVAIDGRYRGQRLGDGARLGDVMLSATLEQIGQANDRMPHIWAIITPENAPAQALFARHGFSRYGRSSGNADEIIYSRPAQTATRGAGVLTLAGRIRRMLGGRWS
jgi:ribosomal protein S18 acetylase RimI-like enzyme